MKKLIFGLVTLLVLGACSSHDIEPMNVKESKEAKFAKDFNTTFNVTEEVYANHQWGMNTVPLVNVTTTRAAYPNGNEWASDGYTVPADITDAERAAVLAVFNQVGEAEYESLIDWEDFFVQQVYKGTKHYTAGNGGDVLGSDHMDWLCTVTN